MQEAFKAVLDFARSDESDPKKIAERGAVLIEAITSRLDTLDNDRGITQFCVGAMIKKLREGDAWKLFPETQESWLFGDFCREVLAMSQSKAMGLLRVWEKSQYVGMTAEEVEDVGWSIADAILRVAKSRSDIDNLLKRREKTMTRAEFLAIINTPPPLGEEVQGERFPIPPVPKKKRAFKVDVHEDQFLQETLERAAKKMGKELNKDVSPEQAMFYILTEWRTFSSN